MEVMIEQKKPIFYELPLEMQFEEPVKEVIEMPVPILL